MGVWRWRNLQWRVRNSYPSEGNYTITLLQDSLVCVEDITVEPIPVPAFNASASTVCGYEGVEFSVLNPNPFSEYLWDFGDGTTDTSRTITHAFVSQATTQMYTVTLQENGINCGEPIVISVLDSPDPTISSPSNFVECSGTQTATITIENQSVTDASNTGYTINWGDGSPIVNQNSGWTTLSHTYTGEGFFEITVTATGPFTCPTATAVFPFFNGSNPGGGITSPGGTTGLCISDVLTFFISGTENNPVGTIYEI